MKTGPILKSAGTRRAGRVRATPPVPALLAQGQAERQLYEHDPAVIRTLRRLGVVADEQGDTVSTTTVDAAGHWLSRL